MHSMTNELLQSFKYNELSQTLLVFKFIFQCDMMLLGV